MANSFIKIHQTSNAIQAEIMLQMLKQNNIEAVSLNKKDSSYQAFGLIEIYCPDEQHIAALQLIKTNFTDEE